MADNGTVEIPDRPVFKAAEVCELVKVQPYVLRTWEAEFPELGEAKATGSGRVYRRGDVERVLRIKHLLLVEGLTLAGARRRMEADASGEAAPVLPAAPVATASTVASARHAVAEPASVGPDVRERILSVRSGLQSLLEMLSGSAVADSRGEFSLEAESDGAAAGAKGGKGSAGRGVASPKRKRSS